MQSNTYTKAVVALAAATALTDAANAATITWGAATELVSNADLISGAISTVGVNGGNDVVTINGVTYEAYAGPDYGQFTADVASLTTTYENQAGGFSGDIGIYSPDTGDAGLNSLLDTQLYDTTNGTGSITVTFNTVIGAEYRFQLMGLADDRGDFNTRTTSPDGGTTSLLRFADLDSDTVSHVTYSIGSFTADSSTQSITITGGNGSSGGFSGLIIAQDTAAVPEPSSTALLGLGGLALILRRRK